MPVAVLSFASKKWLDELTPLSLTYTFNQRRKKIVSSLPRVLVLHIRRTKWPLGKLKDHVTFPIEVLDMGPFCTAEAISNAGGSSIYQLVGVVNHHGQGMNKGHYTSFCLDADRSTWLFYNDKEVGVASPDDVLASQGFLLFYELETEKTQPVI